MNEIKNKWHKFKKKLPRKQAVRTCGSIAADSSTKLVGRHASTSLSFQIFDMINDVITNVKRSGSIMREDHLDTY